MKRCVVLITAMNEEEAAGIARALVDERLAACVNIVPRIRSIYRWKGGVQDDAETLLIAKTRAEKFDALKARVKEMHSYEVPEVIALPIEAGLDAYLGWLDESTA